MPTLPHRCGTPVVLESFQYLAIYVTRNAEEFQGQNLVPQLEHLCRDVAHWQVLPVSLMGQAALFKMVSLTCILYVLQNTPYRVTADFFTRVNSEVRKHLWNRGSLHISLAKLHHGVFERGLEIPEIQGYYWASQLITINKWVFVDNGEPVHWVNREAMGDLGLLVHPLRPAPRAHTPATYTDHN
ncbi:hypothetical protein NDU88_005750 [Pleurodeles waltl]|uniref:Uncharacterized protein n=1 Tax=Pleurodeles waltl TaxID=8319 RepID=A0AAV7NNE8_PLEWA|nr:hypothetical protein NDU88_005750 [Pleurodeles waltl]